MCSFFSWMDATSLPFTSSSTKVLLILIALPLTLKARLPLLSSIQASSPMENIFSRIW